MAMAQRRQLDQQGAEPAMTGWLQEVQRDPRTLGAFRRRIESLLRDPAVARRVASRVGRLQADGRASAPETDAAPESLRALRSLRPTTAGLGAGGLVCAAGAAVGSIFGRCDCDGGCRMMVPDLRPMKAMAPPSLAGAPGWALRH